MTSKEQEVISNAEGWVEKWRKLAFYGSAITAMNLGLALIGLLNYWADEGVANLICSAFCVASGVYTAFGTKDCRRNSRASYRIAKTMRDYLDAKDETPYAIGRLDGLLDQWTAAVSEMTKK